MSGSKKISVKHRTILKDSGKIGLYVAALGLSMMLFGSYGSNYGLDSKDSGVVLLLGFVMVFFMAPVSMIAYMRGSLES